MRSPRCVRVSGKTFSRRVSARSDRTLVFVTTTDQAHFEVVFPSTPSFRLGAANSYWKRAAIKARGRLFSFIQCAVAIFRAHLDGEWEAAGDYARWIRCYDRLQREDIQKIREQIAEVSLFTADFDFVAGLQLEFEVAPACDFVRATAILSALGALHRGRRVDGSKALAFPAKVRASGQANKGDAPHGKRAHLSGVK